MTRALLTGNVAAAWGARLAGAEYIPAFPITPQTEIIETIGGWIEAGSMAAAKAAGKVRMEGKDYVMADGDVVEFRHGATSRASR